MSDRIIKFKLDKRQEYFEANQLPKDIMGMTPFLCVGTLGRYFELGDAKTIYVKLSKKASKESYKIVRDESGVFRIRYSNGQFIWEPLSYGLKDLLRDFGCPLHASIEL